MSGDRVSLGKTCIYGNENGDFCGRHGEYVGRCLSCVYYEPIAGTVRAPSWLDLRDEGCRLDRENRNWLRREVELSPLVEWAFRELDAADDRIVALEARLELAEAVVEAARGAAEIPFMPGITPAVHPLRKALADFDVGNTTRLDHIREINAIAQECGAYDGENGDAD